MAESLGSVRTVLAFNAAARTAEEYDEVRYHGVTAHLGDALQPYNKLPKHRGVYLVVEIASNERQQTARST